MPEGICIILVTRGVDLFDAIKRELLYKDSVEMVLSVPDLTGAEKKLSPVSKNLVVVDIDTVDIDVRQLRAFASTGKTKLVSTSVSPEKAAAFYNAGIKGFAQRPALDNKIAVSSFARHLLTLLNAVKNPHPVLKPKPEQSPSQPIVYPASAYVFSSVLAIAASTGGTDALEKVLRALPANIPPTVIVQHMPSGFTRMFAERLDSICAMEIKEAKDGDCLRKGLVLLAPADSHMRITRKGERYAVECFVGQKMHGVMPAADVLFDSVAQLMRDKAVGVILTGMGADGAQGLLRMRKNGARTIGQNEETCIVYGMPKLAKNVGAVEYELPLDMIAGKIIELIK